MADLPNYLPINDNPHLARHTSSMAVINTDKSGLTRYRANRDRIIADKNALVNANLEIFNLRKDLQELREIVLKYINRDNTDK